MSIHAIAFTVSVGFNMPLIGVVTLASYQIKWLESEHKRLKQELRGRR